jgi:hypothetical protein
VKMIIARRGLRQLYGRLKIHAVLVNFLTPHSLAFTIRST